MLKRLFSVCLFAYSAVVAWFTLRSLPSQDGSPDLIPLLDTWRLMRDQGSRVTLIEVARNFVLFVPLGLLLAGALPRRHALWRVIGVAALASVFIEIVQWLFLSGRNPSVDDVLYNSAGAATGAVVFALLRGARQFRRANLVRGGSAPS